MLASTLPQVGFLLQTSAFCLRAYFVERSGIGIIFQLQDGRLASCKSKGFLGQICLWRCSQRWLQSRVKLSERDFSVQSRCQMQFLSWTSLDKNIWIVLPCCSLSEETNGKCHLLKLGSKYFCRWCCFCRSWDPSDVPVPTAGCCRFFRVLV